MRSSYDIIGVGFGPANIALAIALEELYGGANILFLEARPAPTWQPEMMFEDSDIQNHPLRDLVTPRNPRSKYSFTNFLFETGRLWEHLNLGMLFPLRMEYQRYISWAAQHFDHCTRYATSVADVTFARDEGGHPRGYRVHTGDGSVLECRALVAAPGRTPYVPAVFAPLLGPRVIHLVDYMSGIARLAEQKPDLRVAVVGGSQSAVEILLHISRTYPEATAVGISRSFGYRMKDTGPFTGEVYFPEFVDRFYHADDATKRRLERDLRLTNYSASDADVLNELYRAIYKQKLKGEERTQVIRSADILGARASAGRICIELERDGHQYHEETVDLVVLATGFRDLGSAEHQERVPPLLRSLVDPAGLPDGYLKIGYDYSVALPGTAEGAAPLFVNGLCESSHGMGDAGSFSLLALRGKTIADSLIERLRMAAGPRPRTATAERRQLQA